MKMAISSPLLTDYYQLSMLEVYVERGIHGKASFELFFRRLPPTRNFLVSAGLEQAVDFLLGLEFSQEHLSYLEELGLGRSLLRFLEEFEFTGDVWAMPEGTVFFENEPILRVEAPLPQAQLVETRLINILHFQTLIASKAARVCLAARGKPVIDFGFRRSHEANAGLLGARACYIGGFGATATVEAGRLYGIPVTGTMAHSFILAHESEEAAFRNFIDTHPQNPVLLIDTFDTLGAAHIVTRLYHEYLKKGVKIKGVRIDSGDLLELSKKVRQIFDEARCQELSIFVSGGLDELEIQRLVENGAPIDGFGVGTLVNTSADVPFLDCAYKMVEYEGEAKMKFSKGKATLPYAKQVFRQCSGEHVADVLARASERLPGRPLLEKVVERGKALVQRESLEVIGSRAQREIASLPDGFRELKRHVTHVPALSPKLQEYLSRATAKNSSLAS